MDNIKSSYSLQEFPYFSNHSISLITEETPEDVRFKISGLHPRKNKIVSRRSAVGEFSIKSQQNCRLHFSSACHKMNTVITLTYPLELRDVFDGRQIKRHLDNFFKALKRFYGANTCYVWVLEFQKNNNPHFHILTNIVESDLNMFRNWVSETWFRIVGSNLVKHLKAGTNCELIRDNSKVAIYMSSYLKKAEQKQVPVNFHNVGRFWGGSRGVFDIVKSVESVEDTSDYKAVYSIMRKIKDFRKLHHLRLKKASKANGIKYHLRNGGGFILWGGANAYRAMIRGENQTTFKEFVKYSDCFYPRE